MFKMMINIYDFFKFEQQKTTVDQYIISKEDLRWKIFQSLEDTKISPKNFIRLDVSDNTLSLNHWCIWCISLWKKISSIKIETNTFIFLPFICQTCVSCCKYLIPSVSKITKQKKLENIYCILLQLFINRRHQF